MKLKFKFLSILVCLILCLPMIIACNNDDNTDNSDELIQVCSVKYNLNGDWATWNSTYNISAEYVSDLTYAEYLETDPKYRVTSSWSGTTNINKDRTYHEFPYEIDDFLYYPVTSQTCKKIKVTNKYFSYIYVRVVDSDTIILRRGENGSETTYNVLAYSITYFDS